MRTYHGQRTENGCVVTVNGDLQGCESTLSLRLDLRNHSPTGFEWGYGGSGPSQLALALCAHVVGDAVAAKVYQAFKMRAIATIRADEWWLDETTIRDEIERIEKDRIR
jgi:hypothetical protein